MPASAAGSNATVLKPQHDIAVGHFHIKMDVYHSSYWQPKASCLNSLLWGPWVEGPLGTCEGCGDLGTQSGTSVAPPPLPWPSEAHLPTGYRCDFSLGPATWDGKPFHPSSQKQKQRLEWVCTSPRLQGKARLLICPLTAKSMLETQQ